MKNILKSVMIASLLFLGFSITARAEADSVSFDIYPAPVEGISTIYEGQVLNVTVKVNTSNNINAAAIGWEYDDTKLEFKGCTDKDFSASVCGLLPNPDDNQLIVVDDLRSKTGEINIIQMKFIAKSTFEIDSTALITIKNIRLADETAETENLLSENYTIRVKKIAAPEFLRGDWNNDKIVDGDDAVDILRYTAGLTSYLNDYANMVPNHQAALDYNNDGVIDNDDAVDILKFVATGNGA